MAILAVFLMFHEDFWVRIVHTSIYKFHRNRLLGTSNEYLYSVLLTVVHSNAPAPLTDYPSCSSAEIVWLAPTESDMSSPLSAVSDKYLSATMKLS